jgi:cell division protein FtsB
MAGRDSDRVDRTDRVDRGRHGRPGTGSSGERASRPKSVRARRAVPGVPRAVRRVPRPSSTARRRRPAVLLGLSTTRRAAMVAIVVCALALSVAVPLRTYLGQRDEVEIQQRRQAELRTQVEQLERRKAQLQDPAQVEAEARRRLRYVMPGETPYVVELPGDHAEEATEEPAPLVPREQSWYEMLWNTVTGTGQ